MLNNEAIADIMTAGRARLAKIAEEASQRAVLGRKAIALEVPEVQELIQAAIASTDDTPRTARLRKALEAFGVR